MRCLSVHGSCGFGFAVLVLAAATSNARAQLLPVSVSAWAGPISPDWTPAPTDQYSPATAPLGASATAPTPPYSCTLEGPNWEWGVGDVLYSADNSTWTTPDLTTYSAWIVMPDLSSSAATFNALFNEGGYWKFPCNVGVYYDDNPCGDDWFGTTTCMVNAKSVRLISLTVDSGATQTNVTGPTASKWDWAAVKTKTGDYVTIKATTKPDNADAWLQINWERGIAAPAIVGNNIRYVDKGTSAKTIVIADIGQIWFPVNIWIIWATVTIQISDKVADDNNAQMFKAWNGKWPDNFGGGTALGAIDHDAVPGLTYAYTIGKVQATGQLTPGGIGNVISTSAWKFKRTRENVSWDNGGHYTNNTWAAGPSSQDPAGTDDTSNAFALDLDPTSGGSLDTIYDVDAPGCSTVLSGITINHTSEVYVNFTQFVTVTLDAEQKCSDDAYWSYQARVDGDKPVGSRIDLNSLDTQVITIPNAPFYAQR